MWKWLRTVLACSLMISLAMPSLASAEETLEIKLATLAPLRSPWGQVFQRAKREVQERTNGAVRIRIYAGGSRGDEKVMVRKMRSGQLHAAAITSVGLSHIAKEVLVLQAPGLIRNNRQLDHVRGALSERFERALYEQGFVLLGWGDVGKTYLMSSHPVRNPSDLVDAKPWVWESDPVFGSLYRQVNAQATPLPVPDVLQGLSNNVIETFYASPVAAVALQWHPHVRYINSKLITIGVGATVVSRDMWERATEEQRGIISEVTSKWHGVLKTKVRRMNSSALSTLRERGAEIVQGDSALWERLFTRVQNDLVGRIYSQELLNEVRTLVRQVR